MQLRLLFHGPLHLVTKEMRVILPSSSDPYNSVEFLELKMVDLDAKLLTNSECYSSLCFWPVSDIFLFLKNNNSSELHLKRSQMVQISAY